MGGWAEPEGTVTLGVLAARSLGAGAPTVVLLHGMAGSHRYWGAAFDRLAADSRLVALDLLGFGASPRPATGYTVGEHAAAVLACLDELGEREPVILVGHSMGTLVAFAVADRAPERVRAVVAVSPPVYASGAAGRRRIRRLGFLEGLMAFGPVARWVCWWMCRYRDLAGRVAPLLQPGLPAAVARDGVQHSWASYSGSMAGVLLEGGAPGRLRRTQVPVHVVVAADDPIPDRALLAGISATHPLVTLQIWPDGGHHLPLTRPDAVIDVVDRARAAAPLPG